MSPAGHPLIALVSAAALVVDSCAPRKYYFLHVVVRLRESDIAIKGVLALASWGERSELHSIGRVTNCYPPALIALVIGTCLLPRVVSLVIYWFRVLSPSHLHKNVSVLSQYPYSRLSIIHFQHP